VKTIQINRATATGGNGSGGTRMVLGEPEQE